MTRRHAVLVGLAATLLVAAGLAGLRMAFDLVGTAVPATVPAGPTQPVTHGDRSGSGWAVFVLPSPTMAPLILAQADPSRPAGAPGVTIFVPPNRNPMISR